MNTRQTGNVYEQMAADYLEKQGMRILERNFRRGRNGEIDIIGRDGKYLVFVEVKYRSGDEKGNGETENHLQSCGLLPLSASLWGGYLGAL